MDRVGEKKKVKKPNKVSSSGREIKRPLKIVTTSSDEPSQPKKSKNTSSVADRIKQLEGVLSGIKKGNAAQKARDAPENSAEESLLNVSAKSTPDRISNEPVLRPQSLEKMLVTPTCSPRSFEEPLDQPILATSIYEPSTSKAYAKPVVKQIKILKESGKIREHTSTLHAAPRPRPINTSVISTDISKPSESLVAEAATSPKVTVTGKVGDSKSVPRTNVMEDEDEPDETEDTFGAAPSTDLERIRESLEIIKKQNKEIMKQNKQIISRLPDINAEDSLEKRLYEPLHGFPMSTLEEFDNLDSKNQTDLRKQVYKHLLHLGGSRVRDFLYTALQTIMTDELVDKFNWQNSEKKREFGNTRVSNVLFQAAKNCPLFKGPSTKAEYKVEMVDFVLRATKQRYRKSRKNQRDAESVRNEIRRLRAMLGDADVNSVSDTEEEDDGKEEEKEEDEEFADDELE